MEWGAVIEFMADNGYTPAIKRLGLPDKFVEHGSTPQLLHICNLDVEAVMAAIDELTLNRINSQTENRYYMRIVIAGAGNVGTHLAKTPVR